MHTYEECLKLVKEFQEFEKVYACVEDDDNYYFLIQVALDSPFYQVNKKNFKTRMIPGVELRKKKNKLKKVK